MCATIANRSALTITKANAASVSTTASNNLGANTIISGRRYRTKKRSGKHKPIRRISPKLFATRVRSHLSDHGRKHTSLALTLSNHVPNGTMTKAAKRQHTKKKALYDRAIPVAKLGSIAE